jgi:hypothetical protein
MDFIPLFGFVFADVSPTSDRKRYYKNFHLDYTHKTTKQGWAAQGIRGIDGKKRRIRESASFFV